MTVLVLITGTFARADVIGEQLNMLRAEFGLTPDPQLEMLSRPLVIAPFPAMMRDPSSPLPPTTRCIRPASLETATTPFDLSHFDDRPTVYFTLGTIFNMESGDLFARVLDGLSQCEVNVIATVGRQLDPEGLGPRPPSIQVERFVPQGAVLPSCDLVVSHGGSGSVLGALAYGLPSLLLPMGADQPHNARRCQQLGVAIVLDPMQTTPTNVRDAVNGLLHDRHQSERAEHIQVAIAELPPTSSVIPTLERLVG